MAIDFSSLNYKLVRYTDDPPFGICYKDDSTIVGSHIIELEITQNPDTQQQQLIINFGGQSPALAGDPTNEGHGVLMVLYSILISYAAVEQLPAILSVLAITISDGISIPVPKPATNMTVLWDNEMMDYGADSIAKQIAANGTQRTLEELALGMVLYCTIEILRDVPNTTLIKALDEMTSYQVALMIQQNILLEDTKF